MKLDATPDFKLSAIEQQIAAFFDINRLQAVSLSGKQRDRIAKALAQEITLYYKAKEKSQATDTIDPALFTHLPYCEISFVGKQQRLSPEYKMKMYGDTLLSQNAAKLGDTKLTRQQIQNLIKAGKFKLTMWIMQSSGSQISFKFKAAPKANK